MNQALFLAKFDLTVNGSRAALSSTIQNPIKVSRSVLVSLDSVGVAPSSSQVKLSFD